MLWSLPLLVLPVALLCAFVAWCLSTQAGTRWALTTGAGLAGAQVENVAGTIWRGVRVGSLRMDDPALGLALDDLVLRADWQALLDRRLLVHELSAGRAAVDLRPQEEEEEPDAEGFTMPALPVSLTLERFAVGAFELTQNGAPMVGAESVLAVLDVRRNGQGLLNLREGAVIYDTIRANLDGRLQLHEAGGDWPLTAELNATAVASDPAAPICVRQYLPDLPKDETEEGLCTLTAAVQAEGSLLAMEVNAQASGQGLKADAALQLQPQADFPLRSGKVDLILADGARLLANLDWQAGQGEAPDLVDASIQLEKLNLQAVGGEAMPEARLTAKVDASAELLEQNRPRLVSLKADVAPDSLWLGQPLSIQADVQAQFPHASEPQWWATPLLDRLNIDAKVASNRVHTEGSLGHGESRLNLDVDVAKLAQLWPGLPGGVRATGWLSGDVAQHRAELDATYRMMEDADPQALGEAPVQMRLALQGGWGPVESPAPKTVGAGANGGKADAAGAAGNANQEGRNATVAGQAVAAAGAASDADADKTDKTDERENADGEQAAAPVLQGWQGQISKLAVRHAGLQVDTQGAMPLSLRPEADGAMHWRVGAFQAQIGVPGLQPFVLAHRMSEGGSEGIASQGGIPRIVLTRAALRQLQERWGEEDATSRGRVILAENPSLDKVELVFRADWDMRMADSLSGTASIERLEGDFIVPAEQPFPLELTELGVTVKAQSAGAGASRVSATFAAASNTMGSTRVVGNALLRRQDEGGWGVRDTDPLTFEAQADLHNLAWVSMFAGDALDVGGRLKADVRGRSLPEGRWEVNGTMDGEELRIVRIDDGVRLLDGTLKGRFEGSRVILESLRFPAVLRVTPKEWRTDEWVRTNPEAKGGYLNISGDWDLNDFRGGVDIELHRYPVLQRSDRYAMLSGQLKVDVPFPNVALTGKLDVDAGWIDLDMLSSVPTVDSDVVVLRKGQEAPGEGSAPMDVTMDLQIGLGPRFYITGYGINSGLVGDLHLRMQEGRLTAQGVLRTRGGAITQYGQRLQLRQGTITFQGDITSPTLSIEALRTGLQVQAGVRVAGTARRPRIDLISYPEVSEVEKLSWFLLGRGPDESGSDASLLFSVGTSFLGGGEPFYRKFGLDEVTMRTGELGSAGSVLPPESVVRGFDSGTSDIERQFIVASKRLSDDLTASVEQALSDTGTVGRLAYRLGRGLSAQLTAGTVNGAALVYRWFSKE